MQTTTTGEPILVRRSARRRRTVSASWQDGVAVVSIPGHFSTAQEREWVKKMVQRLEAKASRNKLRTDPPAADLELMGHARALSQRYFDSRAQPTTIKWVSNQNSRWGSATPSDASIRISDKLYGMPQWVIDYVILHELAHLLVAAHSPAFWRLLEKYPETEKAKAFLAGAAFASSSGFSGEQQLD